jgi:glycosyltransferase involved in cell wall biosynthesis
MRVLQLHTSYRNRGGEDAVVEAEGDLLRAAGHDVRTIRAANAPSPLRAGQQLAQAPWNRGASRRVRRAIAAAPPDVIHVHNTWFALSPAVLPAARASGAAVVVTLHNYRLLCANGLLFRDGRPCTDCVGTHPWHGVTHACYRSSRLQSVPAAATIAFNRRRQTWEHNADLFLALTDFARRQFILGGLPAERIAVKPHFVADAPARSGPPALSRAGLYVGRLSAEKGVDTLLDAFARVGELGLELVVIGDGPQRAQLMRQAGPAVRFTGALPRRAVQDWLGRARVCAFPSRWFETFGLVLPEAMAAGLPVIASDLGGTPDVVGSDGAGLLVRPGDPAAWADALSQSADDRWVDRAGAQARQRHQRLYSPAAGLAGLERAYQTASESLQPRAGSRRYWPSSSAPRAER